MERSAGSGPLDDIAACVADGEVVDWDFLERGAPDESTRDLIRQLRAVAVIARVHALDSLDPADTRTADAGRSVDFDALPASWGSLRVVSVIGRGRFGTVYRAWDAALDREVALKILRADPGAPAGAYTADSESQVIHEGRVMARIRHPNVVTIYGAQRIEGRTGIWMELVEGQTLEAELRARGPLEPREVAAVGIELCRALAAVHEAGLVHRDVKAQNVLREVNGRVVLGDFGTGRDFDDLADERGIVGTPAYLAPEVLARTSATAQSDLYSLGTLLFHLATGSYPVLGRSLAEIRNAHASGHRDTLSNVRPDFPPALAAAIDRTLDPAPANRYASAQEMEAALSVAIVPAPPARRKWTSMRLLGAAVAITTVAILAWQVLTEPRSSRAQPVARTQGIGQRQLSSDSALASPGGPSPDGRYLSFVRSGRLAVYDLLTQREWQVRDSGSANDYTYGAETSRFTSDGQALFYVRYPIATGNGDEPPAEIRRVALDGSDNHLVWTAPRGRDVALGYWSGNDDVIVALLSRQNTPSQVVRIAVATGEAHITPLTSLTEWVSLSPDGDTIAVDDWRDAATAIHLVTSDGSVTPLMNDATSSMYPVWTRDGRHLLFLTDRTGEVGLWAQRMDGSIPVGSPTRLEPILGVAYPMGLTAQGSYVFIRQLGGRDVHVARLDEQGTSTGAPTRLSDVRGDATGTSAWSPDQSRIAFFRRRHYRRSLVIRDVATGEEREVSEGLLGTARPRWEPGGDSLLFKASYRGYTGLHRLSLRTGTIRTVAGPLGAYELTPSGEILFTTGPRRTLVHRSSGGGETPLHTAPGPISGFAVSPDGRRVAYSTTVNKTRLLRLVDIERPGEAQDLFVVSRDEHLEVFAWTPDQQSVMVYRDKVVMGESGIWRIDARTGGGTWIGIGAGAMQEFRLSPSGREISFDLGSPYQEPWIIDNILSRLQPTR